MKILLLPDFHTIHILGSGSEAQRRFTREKLLLQTVPFSHIKSNNKKTMVFFVPVIANYKNLSFFKRRHLEKFMVKFQSFGIDRSKKFRRMTKSLSNQALLPSLVIKFIGIRKFQVSRCFECEKNKS